MSAARYRVLPRRRNVQLVTNRVGTRQRAQSYITPIYQQPVMAVNPFAGAVAGGRALGGRRISSTIAFRGARESGRLQEHKTFDAVAVVSPDAGNNTGPAATPFAPVAGATGGCINQVPIGTSSITRVGRRFANTAVAIRGSVNSGTTTTIAKASMILVWDRNVNQSAALPTWNAILNSQSPNSLTNKDNAPRFKILRRWDFTLAGNNATAGQQTDCSIQSIDEFVKLRNKVTLMTAADSTGVYPDMVEGGLLLYTTSNQVTGTTAPVFTLSTRLYFQDH